MQLAIGIAISLAILVDFWLGQQSQKLKQKNYGVTPEAYLVRSFVPYGPRDKRTQGSSGLKVPES